MQTIDFPSLADVALLPAEGVARERELRRLIDLHAATEAAAALRRAVAHTPERAGLAARVFALADEGLAGGNDGVRDRLANAIMSPEFPALLRTWIRELRETASSWPDSGACTIATALKLWSWTLEQFRSGDGTSVQIVDELLEMFAPLVAARCLAIDASHEGIRSALDVSHVYAAHQSALAGAACSELVFGYRRHLVWDSEGCATCYIGEDVDDLEAIMPGIAAGARSQIDILESDGSHPAKRGPCATSEGLEAFTRLRNRLDACLTGARIAKDRAAAALGRRS